MSIHQIYRFGKARSWEAKYQILPTEWRSRKLVICIVIIIASTVFLFSFTPQENNMQDLDARKRLRQAVCVGVSCLLQPSMSCDTNHTCQQMWQLHIFQPVDNRAHERFSSRSCLAQLKVKSKQLVAGYERSDAHRKHRVAVQAGPHFVGRCGIVCGVERG